MLPIAEARPHRPHPAPPLTFPRPAAPRRFPRPAARLKFPRLAALLPAVLLATSCGPDPTGAEAIAEDTFVAVFVELRRAAAAAPTDEAFARERDRILADHAVTEPDLERFIDAHAGDVDYLSEVWDRIDRTLRGELDADGNPVLAGPDEQEGDGDAS